ncbi:MAG: arginase family protein [Nanoarchaeota archaeon]
MKIINVPGINGLGKTIGCDEAFDFILEAMKDIHSNEEGKFLEMDLLNIGKIKIDYNNLELSNELIYEKAFEFFGKERALTPQVYTQGAREPLRGPEKSSTKIFTKGKVLFVGGDHSISYSLTRAFFDSCQNSGKEPCLIVFDAHADCMEPMNEPTHEEWLRKLIEDGFPPQNVLLVGVRNIWKSELVFLKEKGIRAINFNRFLGNIEEVCDSIMEFANGKELYVSIDIDVIDPAFAPGTGYREIGGLTSRQFIYLIQRIKKMKNLCAVDLVEINPEKDRDNLTVKLGAKIISELI